MALIRMTLLITLSAFYWDKGKALRFIKASYLSLILNDDYIVLMGPRSLRL